MSERWLTIVGVILTVVFGVPAWWALFIEHPETVTTMTWALRIATPVLTFLAGMFTGWHLQKWRSKKKSSGTGEESAEKDAEIARLTDENLALQKQLQMQKVPGAVTALQTVAVAASRSTDQVRAPSGKYYCNMRAVRQLRTETIEAMLDAFDSNEPVPFGCHERAVRRSIEGKEGIFVVDTFVFGGASTGKETGRYKIAKEWRDFMDDADVLAEMRSIVRNAGPVWHEI